MWCLRRSWNDDDACLMLWHRHRHSELWLGGAFAVPVKSIRSTRGSSWSSRSIQRDHASFSSSGSKPMVSTLRFCLSFFFRPSHQGTCLTFLKENMNLISMENSVGVQISKASCRAKISIT